MSSVVKQLRQQRAAQVDPGLALREACHAAQKSGAMLDSLGDKTGAAWARNNPPSVSAALSGGMDRTPAPLPRPAREVAAVSGTTLDAEELSALIDEVNRAIRTASVAEGHAINACEAATHALDTVRERTNATDGRLLQLTDRLEAAVKAMDQARPIVVRDSAGNDLGRPVAGARPELAEVIELVNAGMNNQLWYGPKGCGKTTLAEQLAEALGLRLLLIECKPELTASSIVGSMPANGIYQETAFTEAFAQPSVILFDEYDNADPGTLVGLNAPLANGILAINKHHDPARRVIRRHERCIVILAGNTAGFGPSAEYCSRNAQDTALLDRCVGGELFMDYDRALESRILAGRDELLRTLWRIREVCSEHKLKRWIGTRAIVAAGKFARAGWNDQRIVRQIVRGWTATELAKLQNAGIGGVR